jgi:Fic/DOC family
LQVPAEMDEFVSIFNNLLFRELTNPIIDAALIHYLFVIIHPFQDGNGRMARLLATLVLMKHRLVPFTVSKITKDTTKSYYDSLEDANKEIFQSFVKFFSVTVANTISELLTIPYSVRFQGDGVHKFNTLFDTKTKYFEVLKVQTERDISTKKSEYNNLVSALEEIYKPLFENLSSSLTENVNANYLSEDFLDLIMHPNDGMLEGSDSFAHYFGIAIKTKNQFMGLFPTYSSYFIVIAAKVYWNPVIAASIFPLLILGNQIHRIYGNDSELLSEALTIGVDENISIQEKFSTIIVEPVPISGKIEKVDALIELLSSLYNQWINICFDKIVEIESAS